MDSVTIAVPRDRESEIRTRCEEVEHVQALANGTYVVEEGASRVYVGRDSHARDEFDPDELRHIVERIPDPVFYTVDFSDISLCRKVLGVIAQDQSVLVDNDHGLLMPGPDFIDLVRREPNWDWRVLARP